MRGKSYPPSPVWSRYTTLPTGALCSDQDVGILHQASKQGSRGTKLGTGHAVVSLKDVYGLTSSH